jgi:hypothetical protein
MRKIIIMEKNEFYASKLEKFRQIMEIFVLMSFQECSNPITTGKKMLKNHN